MFTIAEQIDVSTMQDEILRLKRANAALIEKQETLEKTVSERLAELLRDKRKLERDCEELRRSDAARNDFLALVGHELRTPLTSILSFSEFLEEGELSLDDLKELAGPIRREATRLDRLVNDILDLARLEAGKFTFTYVESDLNEVAALCVGAREAAARKRGIRVTLNRDDSMTLVPLAPDRLQQVIMNMLDNAIKFSNDGGEIIITTDNRRDHVFLSVQDFGEGVAARDIAKVFSKFEQIEHARQHAKGTGFGMPLAKNIIERGHNGKMWVKSEGRGSGATFFFSLPKRRKRGKRADSAMGSGLRSRSCFGGVGASARRRLPRLDWVGPDTRNGIL